MPNGIAINFLAGQKCVGRAASALKKPGAMQLRVGAANNNGGALEPRGASITKIKELGRKEVAWSKKLEL